MKTNNAIILTDPFGNPTAWMDPDNFVRPKKKKRKNRRPKKPGKGGRK